MLCLVISQVEVITVIIIATFSLQANDVKAVAMWNFRLIALVDSCIALLAYTQLAKLILICKSLSHFI